MSHPLPVQFAGPPRGMRETENPNLSLSHDRSFVHMPSRWHQQSQSETLASSRNGPVPCPIADLLLFSRMHLEE